MGTVLSAITDEFLQLYVYAVPVVCFVRPEAVLAVHSDVEGFDEAKGAGHDLEENVPAFGLAVFPDDLNTGLKNLFGWA